MIVIAAGGEGPLRVRLSRDSSAPFYAEHDGVILRHDARRPVSAGERRALAVIGQLVERLGPVIPDDLESAFLRGAPSEPHRSLAFSFPFCSAELDRDRAEVGEVMVRLTSRCNQRCPFCSAPPPRPDPGLATLARLFAEVERLAPRATVTLTGGEPTLRSDFPQVLERALSAGVSGVEVQTNATRLAAPEAVAELARSDRLRYFVSLHSMDPEVYDRCTGSSGMLDRAVAGIDNLLEAEAEVILSVVATAWNAPGLREWVEAVVERFGPTSWSRLRAHFSITLCPEHRPEAAEALVRYSELAPLLEGAVERAAELGLEVEPLLSSTHASIPACFLSRRSRGPAPASVDGQMDGEAYAGWVKAARCEPCRALRSCQGVPVRYEARFGTEELRPLYKGDFDRIER